MGLKRRNPARHRLFTPPQILAVLAAAPSADRPAPAPAAPAPPRAVTRDERHRLISRLAYGHAERAGFTTDPVSNWLLAEREIDAQIALAAG
jgi:Protein of unknown function (DUF2934)